MAEDTRPRLGRGLAALIGDFDDESLAIERSRAQRKSPVELLTPNPRNPRKNFSDDELQNLANSIRERGIIQPILVRTIAGTADAYEIVAGERRWRAAQLVGLHEVPIVIIEAGDKEALEIAIIENVQRSDLSAIEEAQGYEQLGQEFGYTQTDLARVIGKSRSHVANTLRLLKLPEKTRNMLAAGDISAGHARALLSVQDPDSLAKRIVEQGMTVRNVEKIAQLEAERNTHAASGAEPKGEKETRAKDASTLALEQALADALGLAVIIDHRGGRGQLTIRYKSLEQLDALCKQLQS